MCRRRWDRGLGILANTEALDRILSADARAPPTMTSVFNTNLSGAQARSRIVWSAQGFARGWGDEKVAMVHGVNPATIACTN